MKPGAEIPKAALCADLVFSRANGEAFPIRFVLHYCIFCTALKYRILGEFHPSTPIASPCGKMGAETSTHDPGSVGAAHVEPERKPSSPSALVIVGPSGVGKGTLIGRLTEGDGSNAFGFSVSHTTRAPRPGEKHGEHYFFTTKEQFAKEVGEGKFLEYAEVHGNLYGTSLRAVESVLEAGKVCLLDIDTQGARLVRKSGLKAIFVFVVGGPSLPAGGTHPLLALPLSCRNLFPWHSANPTWAHWLWSLAAPLAGSSAGRDGSTRPVPPAPASPIPFCVATETLTHTQFATALLLTE